MSDALVNILIDGGVCGVFCILLITGMIVPKFVLDDKISENRELKDAVAAERTRADTAVAAASATREIITAIRETSRTGGGP